MNTTNQSEHSKAKIEEIESILISLGSIIHPEKKSDLDCALDNAWNSLDDILQSLREGEYNQHGEFVA